jgi:protein-S-isoprenylcysteine O-methyltransferase Ste14
MIRHPWHLGGFLIVWARDLSLSTILTNLVISSYFVIGAILEEQKLAREIGAPYPGSAGGLLKFDCLFYGIGYLL